MGSVLQVVVAAALAGGAAGAGVALLLSADAQPKEPLEPAPGAYARTDDVDMLQTLIRTKIDDLRKRLDALEARLKAGAPDGETARLNPVDAILIERFGALEKRVKELEQLGSRAVLEMPSDEFMRLFERAIEESERRQTAEYDRVRKERREQWLDRYNMDLAARLVGALTLDSAQQPQLAAALADYKTELLRLDFAFAKFAEESLSDYYSRRRQERVRADAAVESRLEAILTPAQMALYKGDAKLNITTNSGGYAEK